MIKIILKIEEHRVRTNNDSTAILFSQNHIRADMTMYNNN